MPRRRDKPATAADTSEAILFPDGRRAHINGTTTFRMELSIENSRVSAAAPETCPDATQASIELLGFILGDADSDISVVARELRLSDASFLRLRWARDRVACAQRLLETVREIAGSAAGRTGASTVEGNTGDSLEAISAAMREAVELLARGWPEDCPAGAVEWLLLLPRGVSRAVEREGHGTRPLVPVNPLLTRTWTRRSVAANRN
jgi:hypothetical protein